MISLANVQLAQFKQVFMQYEIYRVCTCKNFGLNFCLFCTHCKYLVRHTDLTIKDFSVFKEICDEWKFAYLAFYVLSRNKDIASCKPICLF